MITSDPCHCRQSGCRCPPPPITGRICIRRLMNQPWLAVAALILPVAIGFGAQR